MGNWLKLHRLEGSNAGYDPALSMDTLVLFRQLVEGNNVYLVGATELGHSVYNLRAVTGNLDAIDLAICSSSNALTLTRTKSGILECCRCAGGNHRGTNTVDDQVIKNGFFISQAALEVAAGSSAQQLEGVSKAHHVLTCFGLVAANVRNSVLSKHFLILVAIDEEVDQVIEGAVVEHGTAGFHFVVVVGGTTQEVLVAQLKGAVARAIEEARLVVFGLACSTNEVAHAVIAKLELGLSHSQALAIHYICVTENLSVHRTDDLFFISIRSSGPQFLWIGFFKVAHAQS